MSLRIHRCEDLPTKSPIPSHKISGERVYKFDNLSDQFEGRFVYISLSTNGLVFYWKQPEKATESIYVDEIIDVFVGCCIDTTKQKDVQKRVDAHVRRIFADSFTVAACTINSCFFTMMVGTDSVNPSPLIFLTDTDESAKAWVTKLRRLSMRLSRDCITSGCFYYWERLFTKVVCTCGDSGFTANDIVDALFPVKNKEDRKDIENSLRSLDIFEDGKAVGPLDVDNDLIFKCYWSILERTEVKNIYKEKYGFLEYSKCAVSLRPVFCFFIYY
ncbi:hypothetical protein AB6A40_006641 [Gnathostoma spinigerum]|uniref:PLC-beta PH domain-containing protein n=1 Tax=Gnathostoma spinigerum TaxID=75299 RepID=A0ABD6EL53_9BILA